MTSEAGSTRGQEEPLFEAIEYLERARQQLLEARRWARMERFRRQLLQLGALLRNGIAMALLTLALNAGLGFSLSWSFSLAVLCTMVPVLSFVWWAKGGEKLEGFLADVHCSDEVILAWGEGSLFEWPTTHPELGIEEGGTWQQCWEWLALRREQLEGFAPEEAQPASGSHVEM